MQNKSSLSTEVRRKTSKFTNIYLNCIIQKTINKKKLIKRFHGQKLATKKHYIATLM